MQSCEECYKVDRCFERRGICAEFRSVKEISAEIEALNLLYKKGKDKSDEAERSGCKNTL